MNILKKTKLAMAVTAFVGIASVSNVNAIQVNTDGSGRVLMAPVMLAVSGSSTAITVTNTNVTEAVKAHLAIRTEKESQEVFDFILYLSPGDTFRGEFYAGDNEGDVLFRTSDDSIKVLNFIGATDNPPFVGDLDAEGNPYVIEDYVVPLKKVPEGDTISIGHIEVVGVYSVNGTVKAAALGSTTGELVDIEIKRGMSKSDLRLIFDMTTPNLLAANGCGDTGADGVSCSNIDAVGSDAAVMRGDIRLNIGSNPVNYAMTGLVDSDEDGNGTLDCTTSYCEKVVGNPFFNQNSGEEIQMGFLMGINIGSASAAHNLYNIDRALSRPIYNGTYETGDFLLTSLPTKYMHQGRDYCTTPGEVVELGTGEEFSAPFFEIGLARYNLAVFNNSEQRCDIIAPPVEIEAVTLAESGKSCADLEGGLDYWHESLNIDGTLLCTSITPILPIDYHHIGYEVQGVPLHCGNEDETAEWFGAHPTGWYAMDFVERAPQGISCGYDGVPVTVHTVKTNNGTPVDLITTSN